jgi:hypothetical protein
MSIDLNNSQNLFKKISKYNFILISIIFYNIKNFFFFLYVFVENYKFKKKKKVFF